MSKEGIELLQDWLDELNDEDMKIRSNRLMKVKIISVSESNIDFRWISFGIISKLGIQF